MITILEDFPDHVLAVRAEGEVTREDYEDILIPAADAAFARHETLPVYYEIGEGFRGFEAGAIWKDLTLGIGHLTGWERVAVVTSIDWIRNSVRFLSFFMPCPVKVFAPEASGQARIWVIEGREA